MADGEKNFLNNAGDAFVDKVAGNIAEQQMTDEYGGYHQVQGTNGKDYVSLGIQEVAQQSLWTQLGASDRETYNYGEEESAYAKQQIRDWTDQNVDGVEQIRQTYAQHDFSTVDTSGASSAQFRSFAQMDGGGVNVPTDASNMMTDAQAKIISDHYESIAQNGGVLDVNSLSADEQRIMQSAVVNSTWANGSVDGYLTDQAESANYATVENYVAQNDIHTIQLSEQQMNILGAQYQQKSQWQGFTNQSSVELHNFETALKPFEKREIQNYSILSGTDPSKFTQADYTAIHNSSLRLMSGAGSRADEEEIAIRHYCSTHTGKDGSNFRYEDVISKDKNVIDALNKNGFDAADMKSRVNAVVNSRTSHHLSKTGQNYLNNAMSDVRAVDQLTTQHNIMSSRGHRMRTARTLYEQSQSQNSMGAAEMDLRRKIRTAKRTAEIGQAASDHLRVKKLTSQVHGMAAVENLGNNEARLKVLQGKKHLTDSERKELKNLKRDVKLGGKKAAKFERKGARDGLSLKDRRKAAEESLSHAKKVERNHQELAAAKRNHQYANLGQNKGLQSLHPEERILKGEEKALKRKHAHSRKEAKANALEKAGKKEKAKKLREKEKRRQDRRKRHENSRHHSRVVRRRDKRDARRNRRDSRFAAIQNRHMRIRNWFNNTKIKKVWDKVTLKNLRNKLRKVGEKILKALWNLLKPILLPLILILLLIFGISVAMVCLGNSIGGRGKDKGEETNQRFQKIVDSVEKYQTDYIAHYGAAAKKAAEGQADAIASKYDGYLGQGTVKVENAKLRSIKNEYGEECTDMNTTPQLLTIARIRYMGKGMEEADDKATIGKMGNYMTALWVGNKDSDYIKKLAVAQGGTNGLNHQIVLDPTYANYVQNDATTHYSNGGIEDGEGNPYSWVYTNYGELNEGNREGCDNIWYKTGDGNGVSQTPTDITWTSDGTKGTTSGTLPDALSIGNAVVKSCKITTMQEQRDDAATVDGSFKSGVLLLTYNYIDSEDKNGDDHFLRVNTIGGKKPSGWDQVEKGDAVVIQDGDTNIAVKIGEITHKDKSKKYDDHYNFHYTAASKNDVVNTGTASPADLPEKIKLGDSFTLGSEKVDGDYNNTWEAVSEQTIDGSKIKFKDGAFVMTDGSAIPTINEAHRKSNIEIVWQDGGRDGGNLRPLMDVFFVQDAENLIKSDTWKSYDGVPDSKSGGVIKGLKTALSVFQIDVDGKLWFPKIGIKDESVDAYGASLESNKKFWNPKNYSVNSSWTDKKKRRDYVNEHHADWSDDKQRRQSIIADEISLMNDVLGKREEGYKDAVDFWKGYGVTFSTTSLTGRLSAEDITTAMGMCSQPALGEADLAGINAQLGGEIPPGVQEMTRYALNRVGQPYIYGDDNEYSADCSGFISCIWRHMGYCSPSTRYTTTTLEPLAQTWNENDRLPAGSVLVVDGEVLHKDGTPSQHTVYVAGWNEKTQRYIVIEAMGKDYGIVVSGLSTNGNLRNTTAKGLHAAFPYVITKYCTQ